MKKPAFLFYTGDWKKDPFLSQCSLATRGLWIELLCAIHDLGLGGRVSGTADQLARTARCTPAELCVALAELSNTRTADISERDGVFIVTSRRMKRESNARERTRIRVGRYRNKEPSHENVTGEAANGNNASSFSPSSSPSGRDAPQPPSLADVLGWAAIIGCPPESAEKFWNHFEASGWIDKNHNPVVNALSKLKTWNVENRQRPLEQAHHSGTSASELILRQKELERVETAIAKLKAYYGDTQWSDHDKQKVRDLRQRRTELMKLLGLSA